MTFTNSRNAWNALWAMMVGRFMMFVDTTIVVVANPTIMAKLDTSYDMVIWVTSAYLLAYTVPLLVAGRLGDRVGPKNLYLIGLAVFTAASLWCGLSGSIGMLIAARVVQGFGAGVANPQTLSTITQIFPPERRGVALSVWGAGTALATLVGPVVGGVLVGELSWQWIFFVNVPIGVVGLVLAVRLLPALPTHPHRYALLSVGLSGVGIFLIVFALQEGQPAGWAPWIWAMIIGGVGLMAVLVYWESVNTREPLIPLEIFADRDFALCSLGIAVLLFIGTAMPLVTMFYAQAACGLSPVRAAVLFAPISIVAVLLAPAAGKFVDRSHRRLVMGFGFSVLAIALFWLSIEMSPATPIWRVVAPAIAIGVGIAFVAGPLTTTATRNLPPHLAGAGSGVFLATQQLGAALGSAGMAAFMTSRIASVMPTSAAYGYPSAAQRSPGAAIELPESLRAPFSAAMSQSMLLPAFIGLIGLVAAVFMVGSPASGIAREPVTTDADG